jgi:hypothetical protein
MSPDERTRNGSDRVGPDNGENTSATQPTGMSGIDTVAADDTYDQDAEVYDVGTDTVGTSTDTTTFASNAPVDMQAGYSQSGTTMADRVAGGSVDAASDGLYGDESMFHTDSDGTPSADEKIGVMSRDHGGNGIISKHG